MYISTFSDRRYILTCRATDGVPLQDAIAIGVANIGDIAIGIFHDIIVCISFHLPTQGLNLQTIEVKRQLVAIGIGGAQQTTQILSIQSCLSIDIGIVTTSHQLVKDNDFIVEVERLGTIKLHATHITTTIERTKLGRIFLVAWIENNTWLDIHGHGIHIAFEIIFIRQVNAIDGFHFSQNILCYHILTIVAQEHLVCNHVRTNLQLRCSIPRRVISMQRGTVTAAIDSTADNSRMVSICSHYADRHRLRIGSELLQGCHRIGAWLIIDVTIDVVVLIRFLVSIGIRTVTSTIDIALDAAMNTYRITTIDLACDIVTTIDVINITSGNQHTGRITCGEGHTSDDF